MQNTPTFPFVTAIADHMIGLRFGLGRGLYTLNDYLAFVDDRATAHLDAHMAQRVRDTAGAQRRKARLRIENSGTVIVQIPMNDTHAHKTIWAEIDLATWINLIEMGADGAWFYAHKGKDCRTGQVRMTAPLGSTTTNKNVTIARLIVGARRGQQARTLDRNPLNLRAGNIFLIGNPSTCEGRKGCAKTDTAAHLLRLKTRREGLAGRDYGMGNVDGDEAQQ